MKKILCILLALMTVLTLVTACQTPTSNPEEATTDGATSDDGTRETESDAVTEEDSTTEDATTEEETTEEETTEELKEPTEFIPLVISSTSYITIVYPKNAKGYESNVANDLASFIQKHGGIIPTVKDDEQPIDPRKTEILIGNTARTPAELRSDALAAGEMVIDQLENGKLVINGSLGDTLYGALEMLEEQILTYGNAQPDTLLLPDTALYQGYVPALREEFFTVGSLKTEGIYECGDQCYMLLFKEASEAVLYDYLEILKSCGLKEREAPRKVIGHAGNLYASYANAKIAATVFYTDHNKELRVMVEPTNKNGYFSYVNDNTATNVCEPLFLQVGTGRSSGMCYIFRFSNGEFFIYDGGFDDSVASYEEAQCTQRIVALLKQHAPDPQNIRIAGWLITHPHIDHIGSLMYFCNNYLDDESITVENILLNIPSDFVSDQDTSSTGFATKMHTYRAGLAKAIAAGASIHKTRAGQVLQFGDATLEILYAHEMRMPATLKASNNLSIVSRMTVADQIFIITGDTQTDSNKVMEAMYKGSLACDFYQTPHHGYGSNTNTLARAVNPTWVLWPCSQGRYNEVSNKTHNAFFFSSDSRVQGSYLADSHTWTFCLPFTGSNYVVMKNTVIQ